MDWVTCRQEKCITYRRKRRCARTSSLVDAAALGVIHLPSYHSHSNRAVHTCVHVSTVDLSVRSFFFVFFQLPAPFALPQFFDSVRLCSKSEVRQRRTVPLRTACFSYAYLLRTTGLHLREKECTLIEKKKHNSWCITCFTPSSSPHSCC